METVLITGANGEIGHGLIPKLAEQKKYKILALGRHGVDDYLQKFVNENIVADVTIGEILEDLIKEHNVSTIFHLAAILSSGAEKDPETAIAVNVGGTQKVLAAANKVGLNEKRKIKFIFPSTIAVYGLSNLEMKKKSGTIKEYQYLHPLTIYGITKLYCENLGEYYATNFQLLGQSIQRNIDFRCVRFPGIISAMTVPTGGTSDYAPEMIHSAAQGQGYESFVRADTKIPFMVMPDAVKALIQLSSAPKDNLKKHVYNVSSFSISAGEISELVNQVFPDSSISYNPDPSRQKIVDSWPEAIEDKPARNDWGWMPDFDLQKSFNDYLIPQIRNKYQKSS